MIPLCPAALVMTDLSRGKLTQFHNVMDNVSGAPHPLKDFEFFAYIQNLVLESPIFIGKGHGYMLCLNLTTMTLLASLFNAKQPLMSCHIWALIQRRGTPLASSSQRPPLLRY